MPETETPKVPSLLEQLHAELLSILDRASTEEAYGDLCITGTIQFGQLKHLKVGFNKSLVQRQSPRHNSD